MRLDPLFKNIFGLPPALDSPTSSQSPRRGSGNQGCSSVERFEKEDLRLGFSQGSAFSRKKDCAAARVLCSRSGNRPASGRNADGMRRGDSGFSCPPDRNQAQTRGLHGPFDQLRRPGVFAAVWDLLAPNEKLGSSDVWKLA